MSNQNEFVQVVTQPQTSAPCGTSTCACCTLLGNFQGLRNNGTKVNVLFTCDSLDVPVLHSFVEVYVDFEGDYLLFNNLAHTAMQRRVLKMEMFLARMMQKTR